MELIQTFFTEFWNISLEMAPYLLLGFFIAGILHVFIKINNIQKYFHNSTFISSLNAAILGVPLPLCSCGVIPTAISFHRQGASKPATVSFLISTPQTGIDSILLTWSLLGLPFAIIRPVVAFFSGIAGGLITGKFTKKEVVKINEKSETAIQHPTSLKYKIIETFRYAFFEFMQDIARWLLIGITLATLINILVPENFFLSLNESYILTMLLVLLISIPLYVCATGSIPIAAVLMAKGLSPGIALLFLMAGPATNIATLTVLLKTLGKKTTLIYLLSIIGGAIISAIIIDFLLPKSWFVFSISPIEHIHHHTNIITVIITIIFFILLIYNLIQPLFSKKTKVGIENQTVIKVEGMMCNRCKESIEQAISEIENVTKVTVNLSSKTLTVKGNNIDINKIKSVIKNLGYTT